MRILLMHSVFGEAMDDFQRNWWVQDELIGPIYDRILVTDQEVDVPFPTILNESGNICTMRNLALDWAVNNGYDWAIQLDADCIILNHLTSYPNTGLGYVPSHFSRPGERKQDWFRSAQAWHTFTLVMSRDIFSRYRYHEGFHGHGNEDNDYVYNIMWFDGVRESPCNLRGVHIHHEPRQWRKEGERNRQLFLRRLAESKMAHPDIPYPPIPLDTAEIEKIEHQLKTREGDSHGQCRDRV